MDKLAMPEAKTPAEKMADRITDYAFGGWKVVRELPTGITRMIPHTVKIWNPKTNFALYQEITLNDEAEGDYITHRLEEIKSGARNRASKSRSAVDWIRTSSDITGEKLEIVTFDRKSCTVTEKELRIAESINKTVYNYRAKLETVRRDAKRKKA